MMLGACRTIAIRFPFYVINTRVVLYICILYAIFLLVKDGLVLAFGGDTVAYHVNWASCIHFIEGTITILNAFFFVIEFVVIVVVVFVNFLICTIYCLRKPSISRSDAAKYRTVSRSITLFTVVCLACSLPVIAMIILSLLSVSQLMSGLVLSYARFVAFVFLIVLNATLNPCVYFIVMPAYKEWANGPFKYFNRTSRKAKVEPQKDVIPKVSVIPVSRMPSSV